MALLPAAMVLVGCGKMGAALLNGWLEHGVPADSIRIVEPDPANAAIAAGCGVAVVDDPDALDADPLPDVIVLAVKPQRLDALLSAYQRFVSRGSAVLSIAAGKTIGGLNHGLGGAAAVVRAMPNTPASIGRGITVACANERASPEQRAVCDALLACVGSVLWIEDEHFMDAVTAVSGSGPAYVFLLAECLARAGEEVGLPADVAARLARETVAGAGAMLARLPQSPDILRENVTSPGGTTAAALAALQAEDGLQPLMDRAVAAAARRAAELAT